MQARSSSKSAGGGELEGLVREALRLLDVRRLAISVHDACFPADADEDVGRGSPYSRGGLRFVAWARGLGFDVLQLGPQGRTPRDDPSPYRGSIFARSPLSVALAPLADDPAWGGILDRALLDSAIERSRSIPRERVAHEHALVEHERLLAAAWREFEVSPRAGLPALVREARAEHRAALARFEHENRDWLERASVFEALRTEYGHADFRSWSGADGSGIDARLYAPARDRVAMHAGRIREILASNEARVSRLRFEQYVAHAQHERLRRAARDLGMRLYADLQVGFAPEDEWSHPECVLDVYRMGAPPSRTNPEGQPWDYAVLDPDAYDAPAGGAGPVRHLLRRRLDRIFCDFDGVRIDHPHGLVCPFVYDADAEDPGFAVRHGARLFCSPDLEDHPTLARFAIARTADLHAEPRPERWADDWVVRLDEAQVARYSRLFDEIVEAALRHGSGREEIACEVLSTLPYPLRRVLERHGLGRFRVTQKASIADPRDGYRSENASPEDWIMAGNHDTPPVWRVVRDWAESGQTAPRASWLAERLAPAGTRPSDLASRMARDAGLLAHGLFADLFTSPARQVMIFFADVLGIEESYNVPGIRRAENWTLRVPPDYVDLHAARCAGLRALDLPFAFALALRSGPADSGRRRVAEALLARSPAGREALR